MKWDDLWMGEKKKRSNYIWTRPDWRKSFMIFTGDSFITNLTWNGPLIHWTSIIKKYSSTSNFLFILLKFLKTVNPEEDWEAPAIGCGPERWCIWHKKCLLSSFCEDQRREWDSGELQTCWLGPVGPARAGTHNHLTIPSLDTAGPVQTGI